MKAWMKALSVAFVVGSLHIPASVQAEDTETFPMEARGDTLYEAREKADRLARSICRSNRDLKRAVQVLEGHCRQDGSEIHCYGLRYVCAER